MILYRNNLVFGIIKKVFVFIFGTIYKILSLFNLQVTVLLLLVGVILYFTGVLSENQVFHLIYQLILILSIVFAIIGTIRNLLGLNKKKSKVKRSKGAEIISVDEENTDSVRQGIKYRRERRERERRKEENSELNGEENSEIETEQITKEPEKPKYYRVKQNGNFVMAEYSDRYELYRIKDGKLVLERRDKKPEFGELN